MIESSFCLPSHNIYRQCSLQYSHLLYSNDLRTRCRRDRSTPYYKMSCAMMSPFGVSHVQSISTLLYKVRPFESHTFFSMLIEYLMLDFTGWRPVPFVLRVLIVIKLSSLLSVIVVFKISSFIVISFFVHFKASIFDFLVSVRVVLQFPLVNCLELRCHKVHCCCMQGVFVDSDCKANMILVTQLSDI